MPSKIFENELINATDVVYSSSFDVEHGGFFGVWYKATSVIGAPDIKIEVQMSKDQVAANFIEPETMPDIETNLVTETPHVKSFSPPPMKYLRFKITGNAANPADTLLTMEMFIQRAT